MSTADTYTDTPEYAVDLLGMDVKCRGIAEFLRTCDTPMTVSIQGDWGTGKTTSMQLIINELKKKANQNGICDIWFNTWQFSVLCDSSKLIIHLMKMMFKELESKAKELLDEDTKERFVEKNKKARGTLAKIVGINAIKAALTSIPGIGIGFDTAFSCYDQIKEIGSDANKSGTTDQINAEFNEAELVVEMKHHIEALIQMLTGEGKPFDRIYLFIDDLDRLEPIVAVELMEGIKNFIDCKGCVFVLAVDNEVVERGLQAKYGKEKYGAAFDSEKARKFFDKIIQVPFRLPVNTYNITKYIAHFLRNRNAEDMADRYAALLAGFDETNPRTIKRSFNLFRLQEKIVSASGAMERDKESDLRQYALMLFKIESERLYERLFVGLIKRFRTGTTDDGYDFEGLSENMEKLWNGMYLIEDMEISRVENRRIQAVMRVFFGDDGGEFSDTDHRNTKEFVSLIQEMMPDDSTEEGGEQQLAKVLKRYYDLAHGFDFIIEGSIDFSLDYLKITELLQNQVIASFTFKQNDRNVLMVKANSDLGVIYLTLYASDSPAELFGENAEHFYEKQAGSAVPKNKFGYYDNTSDSKPRITIINNHDLESSILLEIVRKYLEKYR